MDDRIPTRIARSFARTTGIERDELIQEALLKAWQAEEVYDPHLAALDTHVTNCVTRRLCNLAGQQRRRLTHHEELSPNMVDESPSPEDQAIFSELIRDLPEDARVLVALVLTDAVGMAALTRARARSTLRGMLRWPAARMDAACDAIARALRTGGRPARARWA